jgi:hypothetical protein
VRQQGFVKISDIVAIARDGQHVRTTGYQRTANGHARNTTTNAKSGTATRNLTVSHSKETGTTTRSANYTTTDGRSGSMSDVIQRTDDGYTRATTRTLPDGESHTRSVDASCNQQKTGECIKQVGTGQQP